MTTSSSESGRLPSKPILGRYRLEEVLGRGGMGTVYRARDLEAGRDVALKFLRGHPDLKRVERFRREGQAAALLDHPGIVRVHAAGEEQGRSFLVYELVEGAEDLGHAAAGLPLKRRVELVRDAARALGYAHQQGVVHRDVKPENLLVDREGRLRVADFGLARLQGADRLTRTGAVVGTPYYMSPEQITDGSNVGAPSDVWSLGVVLYEVLCGATPFRGESLTELIRQIVDGRVPPLREAIPDLPQALEGICLRAMTVDPQARYPHAGALADDLEAWLGGSRVSVEAVGSRRPAAGLVGALLLGLLIAVAVLGGQGGADPSPEGQAGGEVPALSQAPQPPPTTPVELTRWYARFPPRPDEETQCVFLTPTRLAIWSRNGPGLVTFWELGQDGTPVQLGERSVPNLRDVRVDQERRQVVVLAGRVVSWWETGLLAKGERLAKWKVPPGEALSLYELAIVPGPNPRVAVAGSGPEETSLVLVLELSPGDPQPRRVQTWHLAGKAAYRLAAGGDGGSLLVAHGSHVSPNPVEEGFLSLLVLDEPEPRWATAEMEGVTGMALAPDGETMAVIRRTGRLQMVSMQTGTRRDLVGTGVAGEGISRLLKGTLAHGGEGRALAFLDDERLVSVSGAPRIKGGNELRVWRVSDGEETFRLQDQEQAFFSVAVSPGGRWLLLGVMNGQPELRGTRIADGR